MFAVFNYRITFTLPLHYRSNKAAIKTKQNETNYNYINRKISC